jgi:hypothetical protein
MLPEITELELNMEQEEDLPPLGKSFLFDFATGQFVKRDGKLVLVEGRDAVKAWIEKVILTEKFRYEIYKGMEYGVSLEDLKGSALSIVFVETEVKRELEEAITKHAYIQSLSQWEFTRGESSLIISFKVNLVNGTAFSQEVSV